MQQEELELGTWKAACAGDNVAADGVDEGGKEEGGEDEVVAAEEAGNLFLGSPDPLRYYYPTFYTLESLIKSSISISFTV
ncbi:MAG: hypothetical protein FRX48_07766 [Lasallia pustulata]|uniref:Uncharacterized protein n=1 Tax=Lasallia pustulata TaxID=136370 RepID=A0A5M8PIT8_9LECA|nr:MAG: hypothetical protein FRX48_07766 [Lasallia pustulata]